MKIAYVSIYPKKGEKHPYTSGVAFFTRELSANTPFKKEDKLFILCNKINNKSEKYKDDDYFIRRCFDRNPKFIYQIINEVKTIKPDLIHLQQELALFGSPITAFLLQWLLFVLRLMGNKTVITLHGIVPLSSIDKNFIKENNSSLPIWFVKIAFFIIYKPLCLWSAKVIVHGEYFKNVLIKEYGVSANKIEATDIGIERLTGGIKASACKILNISSKKNIVLYMGYLTGYKGLDLLIEGFSKYAKLNKKAYLIIGAGKHPKLFDNKDYLTEYKRIEDKAREMIPKDQYRWVGFIQEKEMKEYFGASDVSVYPYTICMGPSGPMAISIAHNRPFLASRAFEKIITDSRMLFRQNPDDLSKALSYFFDNQNYFNREVTKIRQKRSWTKIGKKTYNIYLSLIKS